MDLQSTAAAVVVTAVVDIVVATGAVVVEGSAPLEHATTTNASITGTTLRIGPGYPGCP
jgi:hypothetical protein